jgi:hypothetical protein
MLTKSDRVLAHGALAAVLAMAALAGGCSSTPMFGNSSPFGSTSSIDRTFIGAAQTWDFDKNGSVSCEEWKQYATTSLHEADANGDGTLDAEEFKKMAATDRLFEVADLSYYDGNNDGRVTVEEITGKQNVAFKMLDKNGDCQIDRNETVQVLQIDKPKEKEVDQSSPSMRR